MNTAPQKKKYLGITSAVAVAALVLAACGGENGDADDSAEGADAREGGTLTVGLGAGTTCVFPQQTFNFNAASISRGIVDSLTDQDPETGEIVPWLAEAWDINDDATEYTFYLRDDVTFSDGSPFDAETVVANLDYISEMGPQSSRGSAYMGNYDYSEAVDEHTVTVHFSQPSAHFLVGTSTLIFGMLSLDTTALTIEERCQGDIVGTGPFVLQEYEQDSRALVTRREGYDWSSELAVHSGDAYLEEIEYLWQEVSNVRAGALTSGQIDVAMDLSPQDVQSVEEAGASVMPGTQPGLPGSFVSNVERDVSGDAGVRRAMNIALNREEIVQTVLGDHFDPAYSIVTSTLREYNDNSEELAYDPEGAEEILDEAGWEMGDDGVRERDGIPLEFTVTYTDDFGAFYTPMLQLIQQQLGDIGMDVNLDNTTTAGITEILQTHEFDFFITTITESDPDMVRAAISNYMHPSAVEDHGLEEPFDEQQALSDPDERAVVWGDIQDIVMEHALLIPVFEGTQLTGVGENVEDVRYDFKSMVTFYDTYLTD
ncbi:ABC transporter substrate-binding protein [Nesterenkonia muleiensis]|uniref:ABC transporter substrate-binding protein n=1 Tax=Nesterenkonia muleiensis TaxID=2282648 RepID=UPI000E7079AA|nr:ABC transporter substrate-binding protein [Nesterenkonia muleiensis]